MKGKRNKYYCFGIEEEKALVGTKILRYIRGYGCFEGVLKSAIFGTFRIEYPHSRYEELSKSELQELTQYDQPTKENVLHWKKKYYELKDQICKSENKNVAPKCEAIDCDSEKAYFNNEGMHRIGRFCCKHKKKDMANVFSPKCWYGKCKKEAIFNFESKDFPVLCQEHKLTGMIRFGDAKSCEHEGCEEMPRFSLPWQKRATHCIKHRTRSMANKFAKRCTHEGCDQNALFNDEESSGGKFCEAHKHEGMVKVVGKKCAFETCTENAHFNFKGNRKALYCKIHKLDGMEYTTKDKKCIAIKCVKRATYGLLGALPEFCRSHKHDGMVLVYHSICEIQECMVGASFNYPGEKSKRFCQKHKMNGMINLRQRKCGHDGCYNRVYGSNKLCAQHKELPLPPRAEKHRNQFTTPKTEQQLQPSENPHFMQPVDYLPSSHQVDRHEQNILGGRNDQLLQSKHGHPALRLGQSQLAHPPENRQPPTQMGNVTILGEERHPLGPAIAMDTSGHTIQRTEGHNQISHEIEALHRMSHHRQLSVNGQRIFPRVEGHSFHRVGDQNQTSRHRTEEQHQPQGKITEFYYGSS